jgi:hypothetical protein
MSVTTLYRIHSAGRHVDTTTDSDVATDRVRAGFVVTAETRREDAT